MAANCATGNGPPSVTSALVTANSGTAGMVSYGLLIGSPIEPGVLTFNNQPHF